MLVASPRWILLAAIVSFCPAFVHAQGKQSAADAGSTVYKKTLPSTVLIRSDRSETRYSTGTGTLVDRGRRLVLTNYHVVADVEPATVFFSRVQDKVVISDPKFYMSRRAQIGIKGEVIELNKTADLALIQLEKVPDGVNALKFAKDSPEPGQSVHSIGNPGRSGALWVYTPGKVRQVYGTKSSSMIEGKLVDFVARVIETDSATNLGDSGGPLVNDRAELVGVTKGYTNDARSISTFIDLSEVRKLMNRPSVVALPSDDPVTTAKNDEPANTVKRPDSATTVKPTSSVRAKAVKCNDAAKLFGEEAWRRAVAATERLHLERKFDLLVETIEPPAEETAKIKEMTAAERMKYARMRSDQRVDAENLSGIHIVVYMSLPKFVYVRETSSVVGTLPQNFVKTLREELVGAFREKRYDEGLEKATTMILEARGLVEKK